MTKMRIYLDSNSIVKYFEVIMRYRRGKIKQFKFPKECEFLKQNSDKLDIFISILNQGEIFKVLRSDWGFNRNEAEKLWNDFLKWFPLKIIEVVSIDKNILEVTKEVIMKKKTLVNFMHLFIAKNFKFWFYTGDKQIIEKGKKYYEKIIDYISLRKRLHC